MKFYNEYSIDNTSKNGVLKIINNFNNGLIIIENNIIIINNLQDLNRTFNTNLVTVRIKDSTLLDINELNEDILNFHLEDEMIEIYEDEIKFRHEIDHYIAKDSIYKTFCYGEIINCKSNNGNLYLSGVLKINSKHSYGRTKKNVPIYMFYPNDQKYPPFYVASNYKTSNTSNNIYVYIKFKDWSNTSKYPTGTCEKVIGVIGDIEAEYNSILHNYNLICKSYRNVKIEFNENCIEKYDKSITRIDETSNKVFSIDPEGCLDIDDVIGIKSMSDGYEISVHIADVSNFVSENDVIDQLAKIRGSSIYAPHKQDNMLPELLSCNLCSLLPDKLRFAITVKIMLNNDFDILDNKIQNSLIKSSFALNYTIASDLMSDNCQQYKKYPSWLNEHLNLLKKFVIKNNILNKDNYDSHAIIDTLMVYTNSVIAKQLFNSPKHLSLLRIHSSDSDCQEKIKLLNESEHTENTSLNDFFKIYSKNSANYCLTDKLNNTKIYHSGLDIKYYTHFTSPIRRYFDILVHREIKKLIANLENNFENNIQTENLCDYLNNKNNNIKKCERDFKKIKVLFDISINTSKLDAYIISFNEFYKLIQIYIPSLEITHTFRPFSKKLNSLLNYCFENQELNIVNLQTNNKLRFSLFQKILIDIIPSFNKEFKHKYNVTIIYPELKQIL